MEHYNSLNVLPFYEDLKYQNGKKWYAYGSVFPLISRNDAVIPFQLIVQDDIASVISFSVVDAKSGSEVYSELTKPEIINKFSSLGYSVIKLKETAFPGSYTLKSGTYYLILKLQGSSKQYTYYSEVFVACDSVENYLKITYWNDDNIYYTGGEINYEGDFKFVCYIQATIGKPDYDFEEELTKRGGYSFLESQISSKTYKFKFIAPEFLCDGLRLVRLSDYIQISEDGRNYNALTFAYEPEWQAQGDLASVEAEFTVDNIIQKIASFNRRVKESFYNALLVDVNTPLGFDDESIAQYYKSYIQGSGVSNLVNGLLIRELEELKEYKDNYYAVLDTGEGAAKKILLSNLLAGIGENIDTSNFVTTDATEQNVLGVKNFNAGITIGSSKIKAYEKDGCLFIEGNLALTGGLTMYAAGTQGVGSIYDGLPIDNDTIYWEVVDGSKVLKAKGGGGEAGSVQWGNISGKPTWIGDTKPTYNWSEIQGEKPFYTKEEIAKKYVTIDTEQEITALKHFTAGLSVGESKKKIYEENGVVYIDADVAVTGAMTFYATAGRTVSTIMDAVTVDGITIKKENNVLKAIAGAGSSFDENAMWSALSGSSDNQINKSHLTNALAGYATESWVTGKGYATESWVASKNYATTEALNAVSNKLNDFLEGSDADTIINKWKELEAFLSGMAETDNLAEILETKADKKYVDSTFVTLATKQTITGEKTFSSVLNTAAIKASGAITAPSLAVSDWVTIAGIKLRKLEDGALMLEGNLALTGALTMYASNGQSFDTIYDGLPIDNDTIYWQEVDGSRVLKAREGSGSSFDKSAMWTALAGSTTEQINKSHLTTALTGYATESWVSGKNYAVKATTLAGYGITDGVNDVSVTGTGNAVTDASVKGHILTLTKGSTFSLSGHKHAWADITSGKPTTLSGYGITDAYTMTESDNKYPTKTGSGASGTWGINVTGNAGSATKLQTARTLWGRSFDGTANVSGNLDNVGNITLNKNAIIKGHLGGSDVWKIYTKEIDISKSDFIIEVGDDMDERILCRQTYWNEDRPPREITLMGYSGEQRFIDVYINGIRLHKTADGVLTLEGNLAVTGGITTYAIDPVSASTIMDGVVVDGVTIKKENGKLVAVGGGEAGSVAWDNISGKPSVFATNIANITDLHSSWDAVLKSQKPNWLTAVSIATISDLHANWDALLKATPSAYVTRWPTISEVTGKQNLIVKLNGGTTEGTNQFTYNATGAKTINITPAGIGSYTKSESDSKYPTKTGSGASGTWGIGITGNAATASKWATARTITLGSYLSGSVSLDGSTNVTLNANVVGLTSQGNKTAATGNTSPASGVRLYQVYNNGYPTPYGNLLSVKGGGAGELLLSWANANRIYYRSLRDNGDNWLGWNELAFITDNVASATKLNTARTLWGRPFDGTADVGGNMTGVGWINNGLHIDAKDNNDTTVIYGSGHTFIFGDNRSYAHVSYRFRPNYGSQGPTQTSVHIENASAATNGNPTYTTTHYFRQDGAAYHSVALGVGREATNYGIFTNTIYASDWFRSEGDTGWYSQTYGGGWYMSDSYFIRCYGEKSVYLGSGSYRNGGGGYAANNLTTASDIYSCRFMSEGISGIPAGNIRNILGWYDSAASGWQTSYIIGCVRNYNNNWGEMRLGVYQYEGSNRAAKMFISLDGANNHLYVEGNLLVTGGVTLYGSDIRYKSIIQQVKLSLLDIAKAPSFVYHWNREGMKCDRLNIGGSAQYTQTILPWAVGEKNNLLTMDYATVAYTFAVHTARHLLTYETRTDKKIKKLENRVKYLEKQLKKLGYEEVRTLDDQSV